MVAERLECQLVTESSLDQMMAGQFGESNIPDKAWGAAAASILAGLGLEYPHVVVCCAAAEMLSSDLPGVFRVHLVAPESVRLRTLMADSNLSRPAAKARLRKMGSEQSETRKRRFGQKIAPSTRFDVVLNEQAIGPAEMSHVLVSLLQSQGLLESERLTAAAAAKVQFQVRMQLARHGLGRHMGTLPDQAPAGRKAFGHPSEEVFANLLDFYRIAWDYEPRSFPLQWDKDGKVSEAFTPDFYLPEFDLYVELTTMKQANVTKKNRKIRLLRAIYPHVNIQVFYQKDVQDLVMKYRPPERLAR